MIKYIGGKKFDFSYVMFSDQDDVWKRDKIEKTLKCMKDNEEYGQPVAVFTDLVVVDQKLNTISDSFMYYDKHNPENVSVRNLFVLNPAPGCTMMINRQLCTMASQCMNEENIEMHDWWCMARCIWKGILFERSYNFISTA